MTQTSNWQFGLILAYLLPGFIGLAGIAPFAPMLRQWLLPASGASLDIGPPVYTILAAVAVGMVLSCFRWLMIDHFHWSTGVKPPPWDDRRLQDNLESFDYLVQNHYRYYEFTGNGALALLWAYGVNRIYGTLPFLGVGTDILVLIVLLVLFTASRDALARYYTRSGLLLGRIAEKDTGATMFNGNDHGPAGQTVSKPHSNKKPGGKTSAPGPAPQPATKGDKAAK